MGREISYYLLASEHALILYFSNLTYIDYFSSDDAYTHEA
jgi:hypothetical protein